MCCQYLTVGFISTFFLQINKQLEAAEKGAHVVFRVKDFRV